MNNEDYVRKVTMLCPTCGVTQFEYEETEVQNDDCIFKCPNCALVLTKGELIERNNDVIEAGAQEIGQEVIKDLISINEGNSIFMQDELNEKFPLDELRPLDGIELYAVVTMGTESKHVVTLHWDDDFEANRTATRTCYLR
jgi:hypothetical protein